MLLPTQINFAFSCHKTKHLYRLIVGKVLMNALGTTLQKNKLNIIRHVSLVNK